MVIHLDDLLRRRMPLLILAKLDESTLRRLAEAVAVVMGWNDVTVNGEIEACIRINLLAAGMAPVFHSEAERIPAARNAQALPEKYRRWKEWFDVLLDS